MGKLIDLTGQRFGKLTALKRDENPHKGNARWLCQCDCGGISATRSNKLISGHTKSCGCLQRENTTKRNLKHGQSRRRKETRTYRIWKAMLARCTNPNALHWRHYGGRGIKVCENWRNFEAFLLDMGEVPSSKHSIDRINNDGDYCPENCRWATQKQQVGNTRRARLLTFDGKTRCLSEWAEITKIGARTLGTRLNRLGWSIEDALTTPIGKCRERGKLGSFT
jgi:hypothetical protein